MRLLRSITMGLVAVCSFGLTMSAQAGPNYGIHDTRTMGMGSVSVASDNNDNAQFYNAALLAFNEEIEERTQDGRILLPLLIPELSESLIDIEEISQDDLSRTISGSVSDFNALPNAETAQAVVDATGNLDSYLERLDGEDLRADSYVGMGLTEPGKFQGAGFFGAPFKLRAGYRRDVLGNHDGILSAGIGTQWKRLVVDAAYAQGGDSRAAALQFGIAF